MNTEPTIENYSYQKVLIKLKLFVKKYFFTVAVACFWETQLKLNFEWKRCIEREKEKERRSNNVFLFTRTKVSLLPNEIQFKPVSLERGFRAKLARASPARRRDSTRVSQPARARPSSRATQQQKQQQHAVPGGPRRGYDHDPVPHPRRVGKQRVRLLRKGSITYVINFINLSFKVPISCSRLLHSHSRHIDPRVQRMLLLLLLLSNAFFAWLFFSVLWYVYSRILLEK